MSDNMVTPEQSSRNLWKPARKANILKGFLAVILGAVLISTVMPAAAQAKGPYIWIDRINGQYVVQGRGFTPNTTGTIWAKLGDKTGQKPVYTGNTGYFWSTFYLLTAAHNGPAEAKVWIGGTYADGTKDMSKTFGATGPTGTVSTSSASGSTTGSGVKTGSSVSTGGSTSGSTSGGTTNGSTTVTTAAPAPTTTTTVAPTTTTTAKPTTTTAKPTTTTTAPKSTAPSSTGSSTGFSDSPGGNWNLKFSDDFNGSSVDQSKWGLYNGTGNAGIGYRRPSQVTEGNGELRITGNGMTAGGMASMYHATYGMYEVRGKLDKGSGYNTATLLWPTSEKWPVDGEIDLSEIFNGNTSQMGSFAHWGSNNSQSGHNSYADFSQWHTYGVDWESDSVTYYLDGQEIYRVTGAGVPHNPHFLGIQLDVSSDNNKTNGETFHVDWVKAYQH